MEIHSLATKRRVFLCACVVLPALLYALARQQRWVYQTSLERNAEVFENRLKSIILQNASESTSRESVSSSTTAPDGVTRVTSSVGIQTLQSTPEATALVAEKPGVNARTVVPSHPLLPTLQETDWESPPGNKFYSAGGQGHALYNVTIVSAYFDIGSFAKGSTHSIRGKRDYETWFEKLCALRTPLVFYTDSDSFAQLAVRMRAGQLSALTRVIRVSRDKLWSFQLRDKVARIYAQSSYPKHLPNTVLPEYSCAMHAKFEVMNNTIRMGYFPSEHYAWIDVGCFRDLEIKKSEVLSLVPPSDLHPQRIMYSEVFDPSFSSSPSSIFRNNIVWVGGASLIGRAEVVLEFTDQYRRATVLFLETCKLSNSDQQVIYSMFTEEGRKLVKPTVELQLIKEGWFGVGYRCLKKESNEL